MTEGISASIKVAFEGMEKNTEIMAKQLAGLTSIVKLVGITTIIWSALDVFIKPIMTLLKAILIMLFMPLIPLLKPLMQSMANSIKNISNAQKNSTDQSPMGQFTAGLTQAFLEPSMWTGIGALLAIGLVMGIPGALAGSGIATVLGIAILGMVTWSFLESKDKNFMGALATFLSSSLAAGLIGAKFLGMEAVPAITFGLTIGAAFYLIYQMNNKNQSIWEMLGDFIAASWLTFVGATWLGLGSTPAGIIAIPLGIMLVLGWQYVSNLADAAKAYDDFMKNSGLKEKQYDQGELGGTRQFISPAVAVNTNKIFEDWKKGLDNATTASSNFSSSLITTMPMTQKQMEELNKIVGKDKTVKGSLSGNLNTASIGFTDMNVNATSQITGIISELNKIPKNIPVTVTVSTVYKK